MMQLCESQQDLNIVDKPKPSIIENTAIPVGLSSIFLIFNINIYNDIMFEP
jgi:hypothetical protein